MMSLPPLSKAFVWGRGGKAMTPEELQRAHAMADALMRGGADFSPAKGGWLEVVGRGLQGALGGYEERRASAGEKANAETNSSLIARMLSGTGSPTQSDAASARVAAAFGDAPATDPASARVSAAFNAQQPDALKQGIIETAKAIGANPVDLATAISYETGGTFDPMKKGPTTQYGQHKGLIQFGGPQREKYGVDLSNPDAALSSQLGASGAIAKYMLASGFKPGMSGMDLYSTINAGRPGRYGASDANNGGAPGNVADKWNKQMAGHRQKALALLGDTGQAPAVAAVNALAQGQPTQVASLDPAIGMVKDAPKPMQPGPLASDPAHSAFIDRMTSPQSLTGDAPMPMQEIPSSATQPAAGAPSQVAQALAGPDLSRIPVTAGGDAGVYQPGQGNMQAIVQALSSPYADDQTKKIAGLLLGQQMEQQQAAQQQAAQRDNWLFQQQYEEQQQARDPARQMQLEKGRLELEAMRNPQSKARPMTAQERADWGLSPTDNRPFAMTPDGPKLIGGAGQTSNVGTEIEERRKAAEQMGLKGDDPRYQSYTLTGKFPREDAQALTATDKKAILEADEMVQTANGALPLIDRALELNDKAYSGATAGLRGLVMGNFGSDGGEATMEFDNLIQQQALNSLKATFGAAPTEGERKILLDIAGSSSQPEGVRKGILERAKAAIERRRAFYADRAKELRGGEFYKSQDAPQSQQQPSAPQGGRRTSSGIKWSVK